jgi:hypothetical protein
MEESKKDGNFAAQPFSKQTQAIIRKLNGENRGTSQTSKSSNCSKRGLPSNLASNRSVSFVSRKAFGDITHDILLEVENQNNVSINHNDCKQL